MPDLVLDSVLCLIRFRLCMVVYINNGHAQDSFHGVGEHFKGDNLLKC